MVQSSKMLHLCFFLLYLFIEFMSCVRPLEWVAQLSDLSEGSGSCVVFSLRLVE